MSTTAAALYKSPGGYAEVMAWYEAALARLETPHTRRRVETRFGETHVITAGPDDAPPVILIHGLGGCAPLWAPQIAALSAAHRVFALDTVGQPGRSAPTRPSHRRAEYALWLADVLDALGVDRASVIGLSMGGRLAMQFASNAPDRVAKVALLSPIGVSRISAWFIRRGLPIGLDLRRPAGDKLRAFLYEALGYDRLPPNPDRDAGLLAGLTLVARHYRFASSAAQAVDGIALFFPLPAAQLHRLVAPVLVLVGAHDRLLNSHAVIARAAQVFPRLDAAELIPDAGHAMNYDRPDLVNRRVLEFLNRDAGRSQRDRGLKPPVVSPV